MKFIGAHVSAEGGVENTPAAAISIGADAFALFTKNQKRWVAKPLTEKNISLFKDNMQKFGLRSDMVLPHDSYLINLRSPTEDGLIKSHEAFIEEMNRCSQLGINYLNFHPGSHLKEINDEECLKTIAESINIAHKSVKDVIAVIENTAGQGSNTGSRFEQIAYIIDHVDDKSRVGVCIDTCHAYSAGYDLATEEGYKKAFEDFDRVIGRNYLMAIHLNDSKKELGSRVDRHDSLGKGTLGIDFFKRFMNDPRFDNMPIVLETPDDAIWKAEIEWLKSLVW